jgi:hypothetical protein
MSDRNDPHPCADCWDYWASRPEQVSCHEGITWPVQLIWDAAHGLPVVEVPLDDPDMALDEDWPWGFPINLVSVAEHVRQAMTADLSYPVILSPTGYIVDGYHRALRSLLEKRTTLRAQKLSAMPAGGRPCPKGCPLELKDKRV